MNIFRLVLCLAGLLTFLLIRNLAPAPTPAATALPLLTETMEPATVSSVEPNTEPSSILFPSSLTLPPAEPLERFELGRRIVLVQKGAEGLRYVVTDAKGVVLTQKLSDSELQRFDPHLYAMLQMVQAPVGHPQHRLLGLYLRPDGHLK